MVVTDSFSSAERAARRVADVIASARDTQSLAAANAYLTGYIDGLLQDGRLAGDQHQQLASQIAEGANTRLSQLRSLALCGRMAVPV